MFPIVVSAYAFMGITTFFCFFVFQIFIVLLMSILLVKNEMTKLSCIIYIIDTRIVIQT